MLVIKGEIIQKSLKEKRDLLWLDMQLEMYRLEALTLKDVKEGKVVFDKKLGKFIDFKPDKNSKKNKKFL